MSVLGDGSTYAFRIVFVIGASAPVKFEQVCAERW
jgi:hypothetical protein